MNHLLFRIYLVFTFILSTHIYALELSNISTQRLAGQMILIGFSGTSKSAYLTKKLGQEASLGKLGGVVFSARNLQELSEGRALVSRFSNIAVANPLFLAIDASQLEAEFAHLRSIDISSTQESLASVKISALKQALEFYEMGINVIIGPDLSAAYSGLDLDRLSLYAQQISDSFSQAGLLIAASHFPGTPASRRQSSNISDYYLSWLRPYYDFIATNRADVVVVSNKIIQPLDSLHPASQSPKIMHILRNDLGYEGLISSADMLGGDLDSQEFKDRIINSINAGCDLLYFSQSVIKYGDTASTVVNIITQAVKNGQITRERLEESYARIIKAKSMMKKRS